MKMNNLLELAKLSKVPYASAKPNNTIVRIGKTYHLFNRIRKKYTNDELEKDILLRKVRKEIVRRYSQSISLYKQEINRIFGDVYVVIPRYKEADITDIRQIIKELGDESTDIICIEICNKLNL